MLLQELPKFQESIVKIKKVGDNYSTTLEKRKKVVPFKLITNSHQAKASKSRTSYSYFLVVVTLA